MVDGDIVENWVIAIDPPWLAKNLKNSIAPIHEADNAGETRSLT